jgi:hypothetical protein
MPMQVVSSQAVKNVQSNITALPQTATANIFVVSGDVFVSMICGVFTTAMGAVANATKLSAKCGALTAVDICATADINAAAAGTIFQPITSFATAASIAATNGVIVAGPSATAAPTGFVMACGTTGAGVILVNCAGSGVTGAIRWTCLYLPLSSGAGIVSA